MKASIFIPALFSLASAAGLKRDGNGIFARACAADNCARAVTGSNQAVPTATRSADCSSFLAATTTATVPTYASACNNAARYTSACSCLGVTATPTPTPACLKQDTAQAIVDKFLAFLIHTDIAASNASAQVLLSDSFHESSDSIDSLSGVPLGQDSFTNKQDYINGVLGQPNIFPTHTTLNLLWDCDHVMWHWLFQNPQTPEVKGFNLFTVSNAAVIEKIDVEFNSIAWGAILGFHTLFPGQTCIANSTS